MTSSPLQSNYAANLRAYAKQALADRDRAAVNAAEVETQAWRDRLTPLETRLAAILTEIPPEIQADGLALHTLQTFLKGRWRGCAHPGELGAALRHLGWSRTRLWRGDEVGFRALWYPPTSTLTENHP